MLTRGCWRLVLICLGAILVANSFSLPRKGTTFSDRSRVTPSKCIVPLCILMQGVADEGQLDIYFNAHAEIPALLLTGSKASRRARVITWNIAKTKRDVIIKRINLSSQQIPWFALDKLAALNEMRAIAIEALRPCSIWEMDVAAVLVHEDQHVLEQISARLRAIPSPGPSGKRYHLGVRPRGASSTHVPVVNAYTLFSPATYYAPRGYPNSLERGDMHGSGPNAPELIRVDLQDEENVAVIQSAVDGLPDTDDRTGVRIRHQSLIHAVVLPPGIYHPCNRMASLHRYDGFWGLYLPVRTSGANADVLRGYVAQAIFALIGRSVAVVSPMVLRNNLTSSAEDSYRDRWRVSTHLLEALSQWSEEMQTECSLASRPRDCNDAGTLLIGAYSFLARRGLVHKGEVSDVMRWVQRLRASGYVFPTPTTPHPCLVKSPQRPPALDVHAAVQINWGHKWHRVVPLWHAAHAAEYKQVTYHISSRNPLSAASLIYPQITYFSADLPGETSGYLAFQSAAQAWRVHDRSLGALLWTHDDAFVRRAWITSWLRNDTSSCVATASGGGPLPANITSWSTLEWMWAKKPRVQSSARAFQERVVSSLGTHCRGGGGGDQITMLCGQSDVGLVRASCNGTDPGALFDLLKVASDVGLFLEIAWPTAVRCSFPADQVSRYTLYTRWDADRNNASAYYAEQLRGQYDVLHPLKTSSSGRLLTRLAIRDEGWMRE